MVQTEEEPVEFTFVMEEVTEYHEFESDPAPYNFLQV